MKTKKIFFLLASLLIWTSCSNEDIPVNVLDTTKITEVNTFVDARDGKEYKCVKIGNLVWMAENLAYYLPEGGLDGCYSWNQSIIDEEKLQDKVDEKVEEAVNIAINGMDNRTWFKAYEKLYDGGDEAYNYWSGIYPDFDWDYTESYLGYDVNSGAMTIQQAEEYLERYPLFLEALKKELYPDPEQLRVELRPQYIKEYTDAAESSNGRYSEKNGFLYSLDGAKKAAPEGWRIPSDEDWKNLETILGISASELDAMNAWRGNNAGDFLKIGGASKFEAIYAGCNAWVDAKTMSYIRKDYSAYFWTSDEKSTIQTEETEKEDGSTEVETVVIREGIIRQVSIYSSQIWRGDTRLDNGYRDVAYSVRCVIDANEFEALYGNSAAEGEGEEE